MFYYTISFWGINTNSSNEISFAKPFPSEVADGKSVCPDRLRRKESMSRPSPTESAYVQTFVRSKFFVRLTCVHISPFPDFLRSKLPMSRLSCVPNQNSCAQILKICAFMSRISCVQKHLCPDICAAKNFFAFFVRSKVRISRLSCVHFLT